MYLIGETVSRLRISSDTTFLLISPLERYIASSPITPFAFFFAEGRSGLADTDPLQTPASAPAPTRQKRPYRRALYPTAGLQRKFLDLLAATGRHNQSCQLLHINPGTPHQWASRSEAFAKRFEQARAEGQKVLLQSYEHKIDLESLDQGKFDKVTAILGMFRMKKLDPSYRENSQVSLVATGPIAIHMAIREPGKSVDNDEKPPVQDITPRNP